METRSRNCFFAVVIQLCYPVANHVTQINMNHNLPILSYDRSFNSSKTSSSNRAIYCFLFLPNLPLLSLKLLSFLLLLLLFLLVFTTILTSEVFQKAIFTQDLASQFWPPSFSEYIKV